MSSDPSVHYLQLPFQFDVDLLQRDLRTISETSWAPIEYKMNYEGEWTSLTLFGPGEASDPFASAHADSGLQETEALKHCPYFRSVLDTFKCPLLSVRLLRLAPGAVIHPHSDFKLGYENNNFRVHIPIVTNPDVQFFLGGIERKSEPGECWYMNANVEHSGANYGDQDRVHLVIDAERNAWSDELFFSLAPRESFGLLEDQNTQETTQQMLDELKRMQTPGSEALIRSLEEELKSRPTRSDFS